MHVQSVLGLRQQIRVLVHRAVLLHNYTGCYFMNVTNKSLSRDVETTHVWFAGDPEIHVLNPQRVLPRQRDQTSLGKLGLKRACCQLRCAILLTRSPACDSLNGKVVKSKENKTVTKAGRIPGGP
jgi:hypothetical protein